MLVLQEDIKTVQIYTPSTWALKYTKQITIDLKGEIGNNTILVENTIHPLSSIDNPDRKIDKETKAFNDTLDQTDFINIYRAFHPKTAEYTFFSSAHGTFSRIDHMVGHKASLSKFKKV